MVSEPPLRSLTGSAALGVRCCSGKDGSCGRWEPNDPGQRRASCPIDLPLVLRRDVVVCCDDQMTSKAHYTSSEATEIKHLLDQRFGADRNEQKRIRVRLRTLRFRISDFGVGLTPAGFDALAMQGLISVGVASQAAQLIEIGRAHV